jgi:hypothetical protein
MTFTNTDALKALVDVKFYQHITSVDFRFEDREYNVTAIDGVKQAICRVYELTRVDGKIVNQEFMWGFTADRHDAANPVILIRMSVNSRPSRVLR